jgi:hypothetical protein
MARSARELREAQESYEQRLAATEQQWHEKLQSEVSKAQQDGAQLLVSTKIKHEEALASARREWGSKEAQMHQQVSWNDRGHPRAMKL